MSVIVTDKGFAPATAVEAVSLSDIASHKGTLDLTHTDDPALVERARFRRPVRWRWATSWRSRRTGA